MFWKRSTIARSNRSAFVLGLGLLIVLLTSATRAQTASPAPATGKIHKYSAVDADNHNILINRPGVITLLLITSEGSQDEARSAGRAVYPFQGHPDFQLIVAADLRNSVAGWVPSIVISRMRTSLDDEAIELKPYYLKNGNTRNPRNFSHVIADFNGTLCPQLGWAETSDDLRGIIFGADGGELQRYDKLEDMARLQSDVRTALQALIASNLAKASAMAKTQGTKIVQPPSPPPPLPPPPGPAKPH